MALNPYTLYGLYEKGIIDYVPTDLLMPTPVGAMTSMSNPYLKMAQQGGLYQNHGYETDSFTLNGQYGGMINPYSNLGAIESGVQAGSKSRNNILSMFNGTGEVGTRRGFLSKYTTFSSNAGTKKGIGTNSFGEAGNVGAQSTMTLSSSFGGFSDVQNGISNGINGAATVYNRTPNFIKGIAAGAIAIFAICSLFKRGKKPPVNDRTFWQRLNPINWFKKAK